MITIEKYAEVEVMEKRNMTLWALSALAAAYFTLASSSVYAGPSWDKVQKKSTPPTEGRKTLVDKNNNAIDDRIEESWRGGEFCVGTGPGPGILDNNMTGIDDRIEVEGIIGSQPELVAPYGALNAYGTSARYQFRK